MAEPSGASSLHGGEGHRRTATHHPRAARVAVPPPPRARRRRAVSAVVAVAPARPNALQPAPQYLAACPRDSRVQTRAARGHRVRRPQSPPLAHSKGGQVSGECSRGRQPSSIVSLEQVPYTKPLFVPVLESGYKQGEIPVPPFFITASLRGLGFSTRVRHEYGRDSGLKLNPIC